MRSAARRAPLTRQRVLAAAVDLADEAGTDAVTMRNLAARLGVEAMSLYHHVAGKEALLAGVVDAVIGEIDAAACERAASGRHNWSAELRHFILTARRVMLRHPWAPVLVQRQAQLTPALVVHYDRVLGIMIDGGFSYDLGHRALHVLGSRALGFDSELFAPAPAPAPALAPVPAPVPARATGRVANDNAPDAAVLANLAALAPHLTEMIASAMAAHDDRTSTLGWCDSQAEFEFALDLVLDGLERRRKAEARRPPAS